MNLFFRHRQYDLRDLELRPAHRRAVLPASRLHRLLLPLPHGRSDGLLNNDSAIFEKSFLSIER